MLLTRCPKTKSNEKRPVFAFDFCFIKTGGDYGPTEDELAANAVAVDADTWSSKDSCDFVAQMLRKFCVVQHKTLNEPRWRS